MEIIEVRMKSVYAYEFTKVHGPIGYLDDAHGSRIYNRLFEQKPSLNAKEKALLIVDKNNNPDNALFYGFVLVMKRFLPADIFNEMKNSIISLTQKYPFVRMDYYGFRNDWKEKTVILKKYLHILLEHLLQLPYLP